MQSPALAALEKDYRNALASFYHWERTQPDKVWLIQPTPEGWQNITWAEAGDYARRLCAALQDRGYSKGSKIGIYAKNSAWWVISDLAFMMGGFVSVPIYTTMPADKIEYIADHSEMEAVVTDQNCAVNPDELSALLNMPVFDMNNTASNATHFSTLFETAPIDGSPERDNFDLWAILYTSGTTGAPKGAMHNYIGVQYTAYEFTKYVCFTTPDDVLFSYLPMAHVAERGVVELHSFHSGATIGFNDTKDTFVEDLKHIKPTIFLGVPRIWVNLKAGLINQMGEAAWKQLMAAEEPSPMAKQLLSAIGLGHVKLAISGSAPISAHDLQEWCKLGLPLKEGLGQTEQLSGPFNLDRPDKAGSIGKAFTPSTKLKISEEGELLIFSPAHMVGYYKAPEKTAETLVDGWIHTGDKVRMDEDGYVYITGRTKEIFKTAKGKYIAPTPIEKRFAQHPFIEQMCLVGRNLPYTCLLVVLSPLGLQADRADIDAQFTDLGQTINATLEAHERVGHIVVATDPWTIENGLLTHTMKMLRDDIESHFDAILNDFEQNDTPFVVFDEREATAV